MKLGFAGRWLRSVRPEPGTLRSDAIAGVPGAVGSVPDGMACAVLVGVNPVYGLYASFAGRVFGGLTAGTRQMVITTTTAAALAAGSAVAGFDADERPQALFMLTLLAGAVMLVAGLLRFGRYTRFVSFSVMIGFLTGVAANIVFAQIPDLAGRIPTGVPLPHLPDFALAFDPSVLIGALSVTVIVLVQGVGVSEAAPNRDGTASSPDRDFVAQGVANVASGLLRGQPVGGSVGQTSLNLAAGARGRWASIFSGLWMLAILVVFSGIVGLVVIPTLAAVLIYAAAGSLRSGAIGTILRTGRSSQIAFGATVIATIFLPVAAAVALGMTLSLLLQLNREAVDLRVVRLEPLRGGRFAEAPVPRRLPSHAVTVLDVYGSLYYAGAKTLAARLPEVAGSERPVVVLRLRGRTQLGASSLVVLDAYAARLAAADGRLILSGVAPDLATQLRRTGCEHLDAYVTAFSAREVIGDSSDAAYREAERWLAAGSKELAQ